MYRKHLALVRMLARLLWAAGYQVLEEAWEPRWDRPVLDRHGAQKRDEDGNLLWERARLDLRLEGGPEEPTTYGDVVVSQARAESWVRLAAATDGAVAAEAAARGAKVLCVSTAPGHAPDASTIEVIAVETAAEMAAAVGHLAPGADYVFMAAAVADFRPVEVSDEKIKKADGLPEIRLEPTADILAELGRTRTSGQVIVGFAAETTDLRQNAAAKLAAKGADLIVANDVTAPDTGFDHDTNAVVLLDADGGEAEVPLAGKRQVARAVLDAAVDIRRRRMAGGGVGS